MDLTKTIELSSEKSGVRIATMTQGVEPMVRFRLFRISQ